MPATPWSIQRSTDYGETWERYRYPFSDVRTHHMRAAYGEIRGGRMVMTGSGGGLFWSDDLGKTWNLSRFDGLQEDSVPQSGGVHIVFGNDVFLYVNRNGDVVESADGGESWRVVETGFGGVSYNGIKFIKGVFVVVGPGVKKMSNDGVHWQSLPDTFVPGAYALSEETGTMISVDRGRPGEILRSQDNGLTWETVFKHNVPQGVSYGERMTWAFADAIYAKVRRSTH